MSRTIYIQCARCRFWIQPLLRQIRNGQTIICGGCKSSITLEDQYGNLGKLDRQLRSLARKLGLMG